MSVGTRVHAAAAAGYGLDTLSAAASAVEQVRDELGEGAPDLVVVFLGSGHVAAADEVAAHVSAVLEPRHLVATSAQGVVANRSEHEDGASLAVWAAHLPGARITPLRYDAPLDTGVPGGPGWSPPAEDDEVLVLFADPFTFPADAFLAWVAQARPGLPVCGGLASAGRAPGQNRLVLDGAVHRDGAVGVALSGVRVRNLVSQGCRPVGQGYVVTRAERNLVQELGGRPPIERVQEIYHEADARDRALLRTGLHIGIVIDEYREESGRGDFLVRGVLGADPESGALAIGDIVEIGQTVRFHVRDATTAHEDLAGMLRDVGGERPAAALLFTCNGRGRRLFEVPDHDAAAVADHLGSPPLAGFFCAGELGPVGRRSFLHGFTASLLLFDN